jgi:phytoene dehydrogenase-like protein
VQTLRTMTDAVVIGGGLAGLTAATLLGRAGLRVTLFERSTALGGRAATQQRQGFSFNLGPHAIYSGGAATRTLEELGVSFTHHSPAAPLMLRDGRVHSLSSLVNPIALARGELLNLAETLELMRFLIGIARLEAATVARQSVQGFINGRVRHLRVRQFLSAFAKTFVYSDALDLASAEVLVDKVKRLFSHPVQYVDGGWGVLVDGLRTAAERAGVSIVTGAGVERIIVRDGHVEAVRLRDGRLVNPRSVIVATTPKEAERLLEGDTGSSLSAVIAQLTPVHVACLDVALSKLPNPRSSVVQDLEGPRFVSPQSHFARVAPEGMGFVTSFKQLDPRTTTDPHEDERELEALLDAAQPGWRDLVIERVFLPRIEAVGALPTASSGGFAGRPDVDAAGVAGLYLAGDWVGGEGFLADASFASARVAAESAIALGVQPTLQNPEPISA